MVQRERERRRGKARQSSIITSMTYSLLETIYYTKKENDEETGGTTRKEEKNMNQRTEFSLSHD